MSDTLREFVMSDLAAYLEPDLFTQADIVFLVRVARELKSARRKFPTTDCVMVALTEECGETAAALLDEPSENVVAEAVQTAAMACRVAVEGDPSVGNYRARTNAGPHPIKPFAACKQCGCPKAECDDLVSCCFECDHEAQL